MARGERDEGRYREKMVWREGWKREDRFSASCILRDTDTKAMLLMPFDNREDGEVPGTMGVWSKEEGGCLKGT